MKRIKRILTLLLALATALSLAACGTQKDEPAAGDDGAAAEEKKLVIYSAATDAQVNAVVPLFEERYGIEVEVITGGTGELLARIDAEGDAPYCDVIFGGGESSYSEYKHVFQDYVSPEDANLIESCRNTLGYCTNYNLDSAILMYNTDLIGDIQIKGYKDLLNPELKGKIARISLMGGGIATGNWTPAAEFNILVDPEAAKIVFTSGVPITMAGLDVTEKALIMPEDFERVRALGNPVSDIVAQWLEFFYKFHQSIGYEGAPMHDPCAVMALISPEVFTIKPMHVEIETQGEYCRGCTVGDQLGLSGKAPNAQVLLDVDRKAFADRLVESMKFYGEGAK